MYLIFFASFLTTLRKKDEVKKQAKKPNQRNTDFFAPLLPLKTEKTSLSLTLFLLSLSIFEKSSVL
jgi:hypothetical protein